MRGLTSLGALLLGALLLPGVVWAAPGPVRGDGGAESAVQTGASVTAEGEDGTTGQAAFQAAPAPAGVSVPSTAGAASARRPGPIAAGSGDVGDLGPAPNGVGAGGGAAVDVVTRAAARLSLAEVPYPIERSGRPSASTDSALAYDGDLATGWAMDGAALAAYAWFDLGTERPIAAVRWAQVEGEGAVEVQVSSDRQEWTTVGEGVRTEEEWQTLPVDEEARYVRFLFPGEGATGAQLAEIEVFGPEGAYSRDDADVAVREQAARERASNSDLEREPAAEVGREPVQTDERRVRVARAGDAVAVDVDDPGPIDGAAQGEAAANGNGNGGRQRDVEGGTRRIDEGEVVEETVVEVEVDGGTARCNESGGNGRGRGGNGGSCVAEDSGGSVDLGNIRPGGD